MDVVAIERGDDPLDLPPMAESQNITGIAAARGAHRRLQPRLIPIALDQLGCVGQRAAVGDEGGVHIRRLNPAAVSRLPTDNVNALLTMRETAAVALARALWQSRAMTSLNPLAGGCFLTICILGGFVVGLAINDPMKGVMLGTGLGALLATALWLINRRRAG